MFFLLTLFTRIKKVLFFKHFNFAARNGDKCGKKKIWLSQTKAPHANIVTNNACEYFGPIGGKSAEINPLHDGRLIGGYMGRISVRIFAQKHRNADRPTAQKNL